MTTMTNIEMHKIMEMAFYLYATSEDVPECPLDQDVFMEQAMDTATEFARRWEDAGLPENRMLESFCNEFIRACILVNVHKNIPFTDQVLDRLDESWQNQQQLSPQRKLLLKIEKQHQQFKQAQWGEQQ